MDMMGTLLNALDEEKWEEAKWLASAILRSNGILKVQSSVGSTKTQIPSSGADLPTLLGTLLETPISTEAWEDTTWRSRLSSAASALQESNGTDSKSGQTPEPVVDGSPQSRKPLPSKRQYWPGEAKDVFWNLVRSLNAYDKEFSKGVKSPIQLQVAEEATRRWWRMEYNG
jgi:hypothetical protein